MVIFCDVICALQKRVDVAHIQVVLFTSAHIALPVWHRLAGSQIALNALTFDFSESLLPCSEPGQRPLRTSKFSSAHLCSASGKSLPQISGELTRQEDVKSEFLKCVKRIEKLKTTTSFGLGVSPGAPEAGCFDA